MKAKTFLLVLSTFLLFALVSCTKEDKPVVPEEEEITPDDPVQIRTVYYSTKVKSGPTTQISYDGSAYIFSEYDRLYVESVDDPGTTGVDEAGLVFGYLTVESGQGTGNATFGGSLSIVGSFEPVSTTPLKATLVSFDGEGTQLDKIHQITEKKITGTVYPTAVNAMASSLTEAVTWYSDIVSTGTPTWGGSGITLAQNSAFVTITVTFETESGVITAGKNVNLSFRTNPNALSNDREATVATTMVGEKATATGVIAVPGGSRLLDYDNLEVSWTDGVSNKDIYKYFSFKNTSTTYSASLAANKQYNFARTVLDDDYNDLFTIETMVADTKITFHKPHGDFYVDQDEGGNKYIIEYSFTGEDADWHVVVRGNDDVDEIGWDKDITALSGLPAGKKVYLRGTFPCYQGAFSPTLDGNVIRLSQNCYAYGNIMNMVGTGTPAGGIVPWEAPGTTLGNQTLNRFFYNNTQLRSKDGRDGVGELKKLEIGTKETVSSVSQSSCKNMFQGCTGITMAPELWATVVAPIPPEITPVKSNKDKTMSETAYSQMFKGCTSLLFAPMIAITNPYYNTFGSMFDGCNKLRYIQCLAKVAPPGGSAVSETWINGVNSATGYFIYNKDLGTPEEATAWWSSLPGSKQGIPSGWTVVASEE